MKVTTESPGDIEQPALRKVMEALMESDLPFILITDVRGDGNTGMLTNIADEYVPEILLYAAKGAADAFAESLGHITMNSNVVH